MLSTIRGKFIEPEHKRLSDADLVELEGVTKRPIPCPLRDFLKEFQGSFIHYAFAFRLAGDEEDSFVRSHFILPLHSDARESIDQPTSIIGFLKHQLVDDDCPKSLVPFAFYLPGVPLFCDIANPKCPIVMLGDDLDVDDESVCIFSSFEDYVDAWYVDHEYTRNQVRLAIKNRSKPISEVPYIRWLTSAVPDWQLRYADELSNGR